MNRGNRLLYMRLHCKLAGHPGAREGPDPAACGVRPGRRRRPDGRRDPAISRVDPGRRTAIRGRLDRLSEPARREDPGHRCPPPTRCRSGERNVRGRGASPSTNADACPSKPVDQHAVVVSGSRNTRMLTLDPPRGTIWNRMSGRAIMIGRSSSSSVSGGEAI